MKNGKRIIRSGCIAFSLIVAVCGLSTTVFASSDTSAYTENYAEFCEQLDDGDVLEIGEERVLGIIDGDEFCVEVTDVRESGEIDSTDDSIMCVSEENSPEFEEFCNQLMMDETLEEGEERVIGTIDNEELCVEIVDETESSPYARAATQTTSKEFVFYKKNIFGKKTNLIKVKMECTWIKGSKITNLKGTYTTYSASVSCSWNGNFTKATDTLHTLGLDISYNGKSSIVFFGASMNMDKQSITLDCSADYEL